MRTDVRGDIVEIAVDAEVIVISCSPGWTQDDWDAAIAREGLIQVKAILSGELLDADGTEVYVCTVESQEARSA